MEDLQKLLPSWRFHYRHRILWVKESSEYRNRETKHLLSYEKEYCVLATRDAAAALPESLRTSLVISDGNAKRPVMIYHLLDACYPGTKLEIYPEALNERQGWVLIGSRSISSRP
jgi:N6-adenosine-specific RNA methylase IME4